MLLRFNKRGGEKLLSFWWFVVIIIVAGGVSLAVVLYYGADVDIREVEADVLYERLMDCVTGQGYLIEGINNENVIKRCGLNKGAFIGETGFYFRISVFDDNKNKVREDIVKGYQNLEDQCGIQEGSEAEHFAICVEKIEPILYGNEVKRGEIEIITASNNQGEKII